MGWNALATTVPGLYCLREEKKNTGNLCASCTFLVVSGAWGEQADLRPQEGLQPPDWGVAAHCTHRRTVSVLDGELFARAVASSCFGVCPDHFSLHPHRVSPSDTSGHFTHTLQAWGPAELFGLCSLGNSVISTAVPALVMGRWEFK